MSEKKRQTDEPSWITEIGNSLDRSLDELDQPVRDQLARRRQSLLRSAKKNRLIKHTAWVGAAAAASVMAIMVMPHFHQLTSLLVQDDSVLQHLELLEDMEMLEAMGEVPGDV